MKRISLTQIQKEARCEEYTQLAEYVMDMIERGRYKPLKASGTNGKKPALYNEYWVVEQAKDYSQYIEELEYKLVPKIQIDYYLGHLEQYVNDRRWVLQLNEYLAERQEHLEYQESVNERCFEIWCREKFIKKEEGSRILKRLGIDRDFLNMYETTEPIAYYSQNKKVPQNVLIIENKDTFYTFRKYMLELSCGLPQGGKASCMQEQLSGTQSDSQGIYGSVSWMPESATKQAYSQILGLEIGTLIYGAGKGILSAFSDFGICMEPYLNHKDNVFYYFGDLDYEGIIMYESFCRMYGGNRSIRAFVPGYQKMLREVQTRGIRKRLPDMKEGQNRNIEREFLDSFGADDQAEMLSILEEGKYVPQEIITLSDISGG